MTEEKKEKINNAELYIDYEDMTDFLNDYVICFKLDVYFRGALQSEEALLQNAVKNRHKLKILKGCLDKVIRNPDSRFVDSVNRFINLKSKVFVILDLVPIALKFWNLAKTAANDEKKTLEVQLDANEQFVIAYTKVDSKQKEKEKVEVNIKTDNGIICSNAIETESYQKQNRRDNKEEVKLKKSKIYNGESQSTEQGSSNIVLDVNVTDGIKLIDDKCINNSIKNTVEEKLTTTMKKISPKLKNSKAYVELQNDIKEFLKSYNLKLNNFSNNQKGVNVTPEIIERGKRDVLLEPVKASNKTTNPFLEENNCFKSEESSQEKRILLKYFNSEINGYELKPSFLEKFLKSFKKFERIFLFSEYCSSSEEVKYEAENTMDRHKHEIGKILSDLHYVNNAEHNIKDALRSIFLDQTTTTVSQNIFSFDIKKVQKVKSIAVNKTSDKSTADDTFELDLKTENLNDEADELVEQLNKNMSFKIDTDGKKLFTVGGQDFKASESKQVVFNCKNEKVKISFIDSQIFVSTENSEFHISIRKRKSVDILNNCTQTETRQ